MEVKYILYILFISDFSHKLSFATNVRVKMSTESRLDERMRLSYYI